jgi:hypothetical protein
MTFSPIAKAVGAMFSGVEPPSTRGSPLTGEPWEGE